MVTRPQSGCQETIEFIVSECEEFFWSHQAVFLPLSVTSRTVCERFSNKGLYKEILSSCAIAVGVPGIASSSNKFSWSWWIRKFEEVLKKSIIDPFIACGFKLRYELNLLFSSVINHSFLHESRHRNIIRLDWRHVNRIANNALSNCNRSDWC